MAEVNLFDYKPIQEWNGNIANLGMPTPEGNEKITEIITSSNDALEALQRTVDLSKSSYIFEKASSDEVLANVLSFFSGTGITDTVEIVLNQSFVESPSRPEYWDNEPTLPAEFSTVLRPNPNNWYIAGTNLSYSEFLIGEPGVEIPNIGTSVPFTRPYFADGFQYVYNSLGEIIQTYLERVAVRIPLRSGTPTEVLIELPFDLSYTYTPLPAPTNFTAVYERSDNPAVVINWTAVDQTVLDPLTIGNIGFGGQVYKVYKSDNKYAFNEFDPNNLSTEQTLIASTDTVIWNDSSSTNIGTYYYWVSAKYISSNYQAIDGSTTFSDVYGILTPGLQCSEEYTDGVWNYDSYVCLHSGGEWDINIAGFPSALEGDPYIEKVDNLTISTGQSNQITISWDSNPTVNPLQGDCFKCENVLLELQPHYDEYDCLSQGVCFNSYLDVSVYDDNEIPCLANGVCEDIQWLNSALCTSRGYCSSAGFTDLDEIGCITAGICDTPLYGNEATCIVNGWCTNSTYDADESTCVNAGECNGGGYITQPSCETNGYCTEVDTNASYDSNETVCIAVENGFCVGDLTDQFSYGDITTCEANGWCSNNSILNEPDCLIAGACGPSGWSSITYKNYFDDDLTFFDGSEQVLETDPAVLEIYFPQQADNTGPSNNWSTEYIGYFKPKANGTHTFKMTSDDSSWMWIGNAGQTIEDLKTTRDDTNELISIPGTHPAQEVIASISLDKDLYYPVLIYYGNKKFGTTGGWRHELEFNPADTGGYQFSGVGYWFKTTNSLNTAYTTEPTCIVTHCIGNSALDNNEVACSSEGFCYNNPGDYTTPDGNWTCPYTEEDVSADDDDPVACVIGGVCRTRDDFFDDNFDESCVDGYEESSADWWWEPWQINNNLTTEQDCLDAIVDSGNQTWTDVFWYQNTFTYSNTWLPAGTWTNAGNTWTFNTWELNQWTYFQWTPYNLQWTYWQWTPYNYSWTWWTWEVNSWTSFNFLWNGYPGLEAWPVCVSDSGTWVPNALVQNVPQSYNVYRADELGQNSTPQEYKFIGNVLHSGGDISLQDFIDNDDKNSFETYYYKVTEISNSIEGEMSAFQSGFQVD